MSTTITTGRRRIDCRLSPSAAAPRRARQALDAVGELARYPDLRFTVRLLTSELVANCVSHAGSAGGELLSLVLAWDEQTLCAEARDQGPGFDPLRLLAIHRRRNERHRGIVLVDALADRWGFRHPDGGGFCVWFEVDLVPGRRPWFGREPIPAGGRRGGEATTGTRVDDPLAQRARDLHEEAAALHEEHAQHARRRGNLEMAARAEERAMRARLRAAAYAAEGIDIAGPRRRGSPRPDTPR